MNIFRQSLVVPLGMLVVASGCIVIPVGDLLKGPALGEQVLLEGAGFFSKDKIALIEVEGVIRGSESSSLLMPRENTLAEVKAQLDMARADSDVKAVVLRISSPGGEVSACDVLYQELRSFKKDTGLPVVACITDVGASGGYYVAVSSDVVYAQPTAIVGSIGAILYNFDLSGLMQKIGVASAPVKSSPKKDINSLFRSMTDEERQILQKLVDDIYKRFVDSVVEGRPQLKREEILALADGRVVSGTEAASVKLVDKVGYLSDAVEEARKLANVESPTVVRYTRIARSGASIYAQLGPEGPSPGGARLSLDASILSSPRLYYLWQPGS